MRIKFKDIENSALKLDEKHRAELAKRLLMSLEGRIDEDIEQSWVEELDRRRQDITTGKAISVPADEVFSKARNIFNK